MLRTVFFCLLAAFVIAEAFVRIETTVQRRPRSKGEFMQLVVRAFQDFRGLNLLRKRINETLIDVEEMYYTGAIHIGTPPKQFIVDFDTGEL
jgi:hypothetical protein